MAKDILKDNTIDLKTMDLKYKHVFIYRECFDP